MKKYLLFLSLILSSLVYAQTGTTTTYNINVNGTSRTFHVYVPNIYDGSKPVPLMLNIHGYTMSDAQQQNMMNFDPVADTANFIVVRPRGINNAWSQATTVSSGQDDRDFIWNMIDSLKSWYNLNPCKIYSSGFSQGSFMSNILVLNVDNPSRAPVIAAIGSSSGGISKSGSPSYWDSKNPTHPVPILHLHGTSDGTINYNGGGLQNPASVDELMDFWVTHNNCNPTPTMTTCGDVDHYVWDGGDRGTRVEHYKVNGGGHSAPNNSCVNSVKVIWEFCSQFCLPYLTSSTCTEEPTISSQPQSISVNEGNDTSFSVTASGCEGTPITYQWQVNTGSGYTDLTETSPYSGVTSATLNISAASADMDTYQYRIVVSSCCDISTSEAVTLTVTNGSSAPTITSTTDKSRCGEGTVVLSATASAGVVNWYETETGGTAIATGNNFTTSSISTTTTYYVDATEGGNTTPTRTAVTATVNEAPTAVISGRDTICSGDTATITFELTGTGPWDVYFKVGSISDTILDITSSPYTFTTSTIGVYTLTYVDDSICYGTVDGEAVISEFDTIYTSDLVKTCNDANTKYVVSFNIQGGDANNYSVTGNSGTLTGNSFVSDSIDAGTGFEFFISDGTSCGLDTLTGTNDCSTPPPCDASAIISGSDTICSYEKATITIELTGTAPWDVVYKIDGETQPTITGITDSPYTFTTSMAGVYTLSVVEDSTCNGTVGGEAIIYVYDDIEAYDIVETCNDAGTKYVVSFNIRGGSGVDYNVSGLPSVTGTLTGNTYVTDSIDSGTNYQIFVDDNTSCLTDTVSGVNDCSNDSCLAAYSMHVTDGGPCPVDTTTISVNLQGTAPWSFTVMADGVAIDSFSNITISPFTFTTTTEGVYELFGFSDSTGCSPAITTLLLTEVIYNKPISITDYKKYCNNVGTNYFVSFNIQGGDSSTYSVTGTSGTLTGNSFVSDSITSGTGFEFFISDGTTCGVDTLTGSYNCSDTSSAGCKLEPSVDSIIVTCNPDSTTYTVGFELFDTSSVYTVSGNTGNMTSQTHFKSDPISIDSTYRFVITDNQSCSNKVLEGEKKCSSTILCNASAIILDSDTICSGDTATITIELVGTAPWDIVYKIDGAEQPAITGITSSPYTLITTTIGNYALSQVEDAVCSGTVSGSGYVAEYPKLEAVNVTKTCNDAGTKYVVAFKIQGGYWPYQTVTGTPGTLTDNNFVSDSIDSGTGFEFFISDGTSCGMDTLIGTHDCGVSTTPTCEASGFISGSETICKGDTATITITLTGTAPWDVVYKIDGVEQPAITGISSSPYEFETFDAGVYTLKSVEDSKCIGTVDGSATITVRDKPTVGITVSSNKDAVCKGESITLNGTGAKTYVWTNGVTDGSPFVINSSAYFVVRGTDENNCSNTAGKIITVNECTSVGIEEFNSNNSSILYPNPNNGTFTISITNTEKGRISIDIYSLIGDLIYSTTENNLSGTTQKEIDLSHKPAGVYYVKVIINDEVQTQKVIIQ